MVLLVLTLAFSVLTLLNAWKLVKADMVDLSLKDLWADKTTLVKVVKKVGWVVVMNVLVWVLFLK